MTRAQALAVALQAVQDRLGRACAEAGRDRSEVLLVAVTKTRPVEDVAALAALGVLDVGENRDQEAAAKATAAAALGCAGLRWHFVGALQRNKAASVASYAAVVHSVDRTSLVRALSAGAEAAERRLAVLLQVSLDGDPARGGAAPEQVPGLADAVQAAPGLDLGGVMAVAPLDADPEQAFAALAAVSARLRADHPEAVAISAGMTADLEAAVAAGATIVRVGTALLGSRPPASR